MMAEPMVTLGGERLTWREALAAEGLPYVETLAKIALDYHDLKQLATAWSAKHPGEEAAPAPAPDPEPEPAHERLPPVVIPPVLRREDLRFVRIPAGEKAPTEKGWSSTAHYPHDNLSLAFHLGAGGNYGVAPAPGSRVAVLDADDLLALRASGILDTIEGTTFAVASGSSTADRPKRHFYVLLPEGAPLDVGKSKLRDPKDGTEVGDIIGPHPGNLKGQVVGPGSRNRNGPYRVVDDLPIRTLTQGEWERIAPWLEGSAPKAAVAREPSPVGSLADRLRLETVDVWRPPRGAEETGDEVRFAHPVHGSETGNNLSINRRTGMWHCFRCNSGGDALLALAVDAGILDCSQAHAGALADRALLEQVLAEATRRGYPVEEAVRGRDQERLRRKARPPAPAVEARGPEAPDEEAVTAACRRFNCTDAGNAERFVERFGHMVRFNHVRRKWFVWDGRRWREDDAGRVVNLAMQVSRRIWMEAACETADARRAELGKWAKASEAAARIQAMLTLAQATPAVVVSIDAFDGDGWLFNVENGTIDLRTLEVKPHDAADLLTKLAGVRYDPEAECPQWAAHMDRIFAGDQDLIRGFQQVCGYSLMHANPEEVFFILWGSGQNGKSKTLQVVKDIWGDYARNTDARKTLLVRRNNDGPQTEYAALHGARLVTATEGKKGARLDEEMVKAITGRDEITCRRLYENEFSYRPEFKVWYATNHRPIVSTDKALWRRIWLFPFTVRIPDSEKDVYIAEKLLAERAGILNWCLDGLQAFHDAGDRLEQPEAVRVATSEYRLDADSVARFCDEMLEFTGNENDREDRSVVYRVYEGWTESTGDNPANQKTFANALKERGAVADPRNVRIPITNRETGAVEGYKIVRMWRAVRFQAASVGA